MKTLLLTSLILLAFIMGCSPSHDLNLSDKNATITEKYQKGDDQKNHRAAYTIHTMTTSGYSISFDLVLSDTFGNIGDSIQFSRDGKSMYALPPGVTAEQTK